MMDRIVVSGGKAYYHIVTGGMPHEAELYAASMLYEYLYKATGTVVPYFSDIERCPRHGAEIHIGSNVRGDAVDVSALSEDGFLIKTQGKDIIIAGKTPRGTMYGVFHFLENFIGYRCFTKDIEKFDKVSTLVVPDLDICENPAFEYREVYFRSAFDADFCVRNRLNSNMAHIPKEKGGKMKFFNCHHSFNDLVPPQVHFDRHPEYYSLVDGQRLRERTQLCLTNEGVFEEARKTLRRWIRENPDCRVFSVAQNDWRNYCTCEKCRALDEKYGTPAASLITFVNRLAEDIADEYPQVLIHTFAYQYTKKAPQNLPAHDHVIVRLCNIECSWHASMAQQAVENPDSEAAGFIENLHHWGKLSKHLYIWDYACNFRNYLMPFPNYHSMPENMRTYHECGVKGVLQQGNFSYGEASGLTDLEIYLAAKMMWNPYQDENAIIDEFLCGVYGKGAQPYIREYIDLLCAGLENGELKIYQNTGNAPYITDEVLARAEMLFEKAMAAAESDVSRRYLQKEYLSILFMKAARLPLSDPRREGWIDQLYTGVKEFGISEIRERRYLDITFENLRTAQHADKRDNEYNLYYIMK